MYIAILLYILSLFFGAVAGGPASQLYAFNYCTTALARLPFAPIDVVVFAHAPPFAIGSDEIAHAGALILDGGG